MDDYKKYMSEALELADKCIEYGDVPIGALVVHKGSVIGRGYNQIEKQKNSLLHAEIIAINEAIKNYNYKHLLNCDLYVTLEPCSMCAGAIILARISNLIYGAYDSKTGACGSIYNIVNDSRLNHRVNVISGILEEECSHKIKLFFKNLRTEND